MKGFDFFLTSCSGSDPMNFRFFIILQSTTDTKNEQKRLSFNVVLVNQEHQTIIEGRQRSPLDSRMSYLSSKPSKTSVRRNCFIFKRDWKDRQCLVRTKGESQTQQFPGFEFKVVVAINI